MPDQQHRLLNRILALRQITLASAVTAADKLTTRPSEHLFAPGHVIDLASTLAGRPSAAIRHRRELAEQVTARDAVRRALAAVILVEDLIKSKRHGPC